MKKKKKMMSGRIGWLGIWAEDLQIGKGESYRWNEEGDEETETEKEIDGKWERMRMKEGKGKD